jgi:hypothetical protein
MSNRFTLDGSDALEQRLEGLCQTALCEVERVIPRERLRGFLLGGGYGRGEGGVLQTTKGDQPYNDLEFYVFLDGFHVLNQKRFQGKLHAIEEQLGRLAGIDVELSVASLNKLRRSPVSMFSYDLMLGHRWFLGGDQLLEQCSHHRRPDLIPSSEATRLLMNRCSGLLFAKEYLERDRCTDEAADFIGRNIAKAKLGLGDVVLTVAGQYHWSVRKRHQRIEKIETDEDCWWLGEVQRLHTDGLEFKLRPHRCRDSRPVLREEHDRVSRAALAVWLWLERRRLKRPFASARAYASDKAPKCPEISRWKSRAVSARSFGIFSAILPRSDRYPRERLLNTLPLLLWEPAVLNEDALLRSVQRELGTAASNFRELVAAYARLWRRFN